jgi:hypothetical protein
VTKLLFAILLATLISSGGLCVRGLSTRFVADRLPATDTVATPSAGVIAVMFSLFLAFTIAGITQRSRDLGLAVQQEAAAARSIFKFAESVGASANPVRQSLIEYLQAVTSEEQGWLENPVEPESPAQPMDDTMAQVVTLFVLQSPASPSVKSLIIAKVDALRQAHTARISLSLRSSAIPQWTILTFIACLTQWMIGLGYIGKPRAMRISVGCFTAAAVAALCYLAWVDGVIGPSKVGASLSPMRGILATMAF